VGGGGRAAKRRARKGKGNDPISSRLDQGDFAYRNGLNREGEPDAKGRRPREERGARYRVYSSTRRPTVWPIVGGTFSGGIDHVEASMHRNFRFAAL